MTRRRTPWRCVAGWHAWARTRTTTYSYIPSAVLVEHVCSRCPATRSQLWWKGRIL